MSKTKFKKFKKSQPSQAKTNIQTQPVVNTITESAQPSATTQKETIAAAPSAKEIDEIAALNLKYLPIRRDVFKLLTVIGGLAILFVVIYIFSQKTTTLTTIGDWIYKVCNFQVQ
jgi:hypothetical protein